MDKRNEVTFKKSYESDGVMGTDKKSQEQRKQEKKDDKDAFYFNITESSE